MCNIVRCVWSMFLACVRLTARWWNTSLSYSPAPTTSLWGSEHTSSHSTTGFTPDPPLTCRLDTISSRSSFFKIIIGLLQKLQTDVDDKFFGGTERGPGKKRLGGRLCDRLSPLVLSVCLSLDNSEIVEWLAVTQTGAV